MCLALSGEAGQKGLSKVRFLLMNKQLWKKVQNDLKTHLQIWIILEVFKFVQKAKFMDICNGEKTENTQR